MHPLPCTSWLSSLLDVPDQTMIEDTILEVHSHYFLFAVDGVVDQPLRRWRQSAAQRDEAREGRTAVAEIDPHSPYVLGQMEG